MEPDVYLGANIEKIQLRDGRTVWGMLSKTYVKNSVKVVEALLRKDDPDAKLKSTAKNPFPSGYKPELDVTVELNDHRTSRYLQLMGILCWAIELGRVDIFMKVSQLSQFQALPRQGHLAAACHIFAYLKHHETSLMKKHNAINYHAMQEAVVAWIIQVGKEDGLTNLADMFTKVLTSDHRKALLE